MNNMKENYLINLHSSIITDGESENIIFVIVKARQPALTEV